MMSIADAMQMSCLFYFMGISLVAQTVLLTGLAVAS